MGRGSLQERNELKRPWCYLWFSLWWYSRVCPFRMGPVPCKLHCVSNNPTHIQEHYPIACLHLDRILVQEFDLCKSHLRQTILQFNKQNNIIFNLRSFEINTNWRINIWTWKTTGVNKIYVNPVKYGSW